MFIRAIAIYTFQLMNLFKLLDDSCEIIGSYIHQVMAAQVQHSKSIENLWTTDHASRSNKFHDRLRVAGEYVEKLTEIHAKLRMETVSFQLMNSVPVTSSITTGSIGIIAKVNVELHSGSLPFEAKTQNPFNFSRLQLFAAYLHWAYTVESKVPLIVLQIYHAIFFMMEIRHLFSSYSAIKAQVEFCYFCARAALTLWRLIEFFTSFSLPLNSFLVHI